MSSVTTTQEFFRQLFESTADKVFSTMSARSEEAKVHAEFQKVFVLNGVKPPLEDNSGNPIELTYDENDQLTAIQICFQPCDDADQEDTVVTLVMRPKLTQEPNHPVNDSTDVHWAIQ
ncbi:MAG: hypothetical protein AMXMBFR44_3630 [Candidatus Campbellbacteria bacterium]